MKIAQAVELGGVNLRSCDAHLFSLSNKASKTIRLPSTSGEFVMIICKNRIFVTRLRKSQTYFLSKSLTGQVAFAVRGVGNLRSLFKSARREFNFLLDCLIGIATKLATF